GAHPHGARRCEAPIPGPTSHAPASEPFLRPGCALASIPHPLPSLPGVRRDPPGRALADARAVWAAASTAQRPLPRVPLPPPHGDTPVGIFCWQRPATGARRAARGDPEQAVLAQMGGVRAGVDSVVHHDVDGFSSPPSSAPLPVHQDEA
uniref:Uncharacterized protein n=1 Tax=Triticum urartu TaxID=4572 RepID=A0A8R7TQD7_TRIUA